MTEKYLVAFSSKILSAVWTIIFPLQVILLVNVNLIYFNVVRKFICKFLILRAKSLTFITTVIYKIKLILVELSFYMNPSLK